MVNEKDTRSESWPSLISLFSPKKEYKPIGLLNSRPNANNSYAEGHAYPSLRNKLCFSILNLLVLGFALGGIVVVSLQLYYCNITEECITNCTPLPNIYQNLSSQAAHYREFILQLENKGEENFFHIDLPPPLEDTLLKNESNESESNQQDSTDYPKLQSSDHCHSIPVNLRFDCLPEKNGTEEKCRRRGCCWQVYSLDEVPPEKKVPVHGRLQPKLHSYPDEEDNDKKDLNVPFCFYPLNYSLYNVTDLDSKKNGITGHLGRVSKSGYPKDVDKLQLVVRYETCSRVRIRITDAESRRWETPFPAVAENSPGCHDQQLYSVQVVPRDGDIVIVREETQELLFDTRNAAPLIYSDQFLQLSTLLPSSFVYGLGQHLDGLLLDTYWHRRVLWNLDAVPEPESNLYGSHPFYLAMEHSGNAHGVFLLNSNAIEVIIQPTPALTFRTLGGILDLYVFLGPSPDDVISQYTEVIGRPFLPPYWALGYHQCRFNYGNLTEMKKVWKRTRDAGIPFDVQWNDIDYMKQQNDFTYDEKAYEGLPQFVEELHEAGMHYVIIIDPGISAGEKPGSYPPFDVGLKDDVFIKNSTGQLFIGKVWNPIATVFPDFFQPSTTIYWSSLIKTFRKTLPFDGLWIDMNEPSNFYNGQKNGCPAKSPLEHPPYVPHMSGDALNYKTLCMTAKQCISSHYNVHNMYGISEAVSTYVSLKMTPGITDPFIISRSSFPGLGKFAGHWTGDVKSDWFNLWKSIGAVLTMNLLGIPMVGADICGFNGNTTASLCNRWMQLGAFYPFSRNHNTDDGIDQDPVALGDLVVRSSRKALLQRYTLLPFLYTLFVKAHTTGTPVVRPLFFKYPEDTETYLIDTQFLWGDELMIIPVLEENAISVEAYFPEGKWYDWYTGEVISQKGKEFLTVSAPLDTIPLSISGGSILPCQEPGNTTTQSRLNPFGLVVALNEDGRANGELYWNRPQETGFTQWTFRAISNQVLSKPSLIKPSGENLTLSWINIYGVSSTVFSVSINGRSVNYTYSAVSQTLNVNNLMLNFKEEFTLLYL